MSFIVAIQPDDYTAPGKPPQSDASAPRWAVLLEEAGCKVRWANVYRADILQQLEGCDGFMWRWAHFGGMDRIARRLLPVIEGYLDLAVYPNQNTCWHYDDKVAQALLFQGLGIPAPRTWTWFDRKEAEDWARGAEYPLVLKLATGAGSTNVRLIPDYNTALIWIDRLFSSYVQSLDGKQFLPLRLGARLRLAVKTLLRGTPPAMAGNGHDLQAGYVLFQEFLRDNPYDTRVTVIGNRAFALRRFNRDNDFRASGSGKIDWNPDFIDLGFVRLAFRVAQTIHSQSCAIDGLWRDGQCVVGEISYTYVSQAVYDCPGHWELDGDPETGELRWVDGHMWPEEAQIEDFLNALRAKHSSWRME